MVQYWRSQEQLDAFARAAMHKAAWRDWNRRIRESRAVGIWHETYQVRAGMHESRTSRSTGSARGRRARQLLH